MLELNKLNLKECFIKPEKKKRQDLRMRDPFIFTDQKRKLYFYLVLVRRVTARQILIRI